MLFSMLRQHLNKYRAYFQKKCQSFTHEGHLKLWFIDKKDIERNHYNLDHVIYLDNWITTEKFLNVTILFSSVARRSLHNQATVTSPVRQTVYEVVALQAPADFRSLRLLINTLKETIERQNPRWKDQSAVWVPSEVQESNLEVPPPHRAALLTMN